MARDVDSYIFRKGVTPNTISVISSKNRIYAFSSTAPGVPPTQVQIGVIATFDPSEAKTIEPVRGIGFGDQIAELVPGVTDPMTISVTRTALYLANIMQSFGYTAGMDGITRSLKHHRWPFDIRQELVFSGLAANMASPGSPALMPPNYTSLDEKNGIGTDSYDEFAIVTFYEACWMSDYSVSYASDTAMVQETVTINVSDITAGPGIYPYTSPLIEPYSVLDNGPAMSYRFAGLV
jgi:hypothetical protein